MSVRVCIVTGVASCRAGRSDEFDEDSQGTSKNFLTRLRYEVSEAKVLS